MAFTFIDIFLGAGGSSLGLHAQCRRLKEIVRNLADRIDEARAYGWLGEVQGLQVSLEAARNKLTFLNRLTRSNNQTSANLGMPIVGGKS